MKKVIIIEDSFQDFSDIKSIVENDFECPQNYTMESFNASIKNSFINNLKNSLRKASADDSELMELEFAMRSLKDELKGYCNDNDIPVYLIDYLLDGNGKKNNINGIRFKEKIINKMYPDKIIPVLFITSARHNAKLDVEEYVKRINDKTICDCQTKPNKNDWNRIKDSIVDFINNAQIKQTVPLENNPKMEDLYES